MRVHEWRFEEAREGTEVEVRVVAVLLCRSADLAGRERPIPPAIPTLLAPRRHISQEINESAEG